MRIALITLAVAALAFIGSIIWIFATKNGINIVPGANTNTTTMKVSNETATLEILRSQWKTEDRIKELENKIDALTSDKKPLTSTPESSGTTLPPKIITATGNTIIPISAKFLTRVISKMSLTLEKNNGIFGLYIFDSNNEYSTYVDPKLGVTIIASRITYDTWLKNFQALDKNLYTINEVKTFLFPSFYVNPLKSDNTIRLIMQVEAQTLLISLPKNKFNEFKTMMIKK
ncbi:hypothetical protein HOO68_00220 [Candidatus Gracilibacteria bacterium]|nr:hypothetical protein [Candidatus Gracilibacteria bacterium]